MTRTLILPCCAGGTHLQTLQDPFPATWASPTLDRIPLPHGSCRCRSRAFCPYYKSSYSSCTPHPASNIAHPASSGIFLIVSWDTCESCACHRVTAQDTISLPFTSVTVCGLTNSRPDMAPFLTSSHCIPDDGDPGGVARQ